MKWYLLPYYFLAEYILIVRNYFKYLFHPEIPQEWEKGNKGDVILIQGINEHWNSLKTVGSALNNSGYHIHIIKELENNTKPVLVGRDLVSHYIENNNLDDVTFITHSKGGLVGLYVLKNPSISNKVRKLVCIACPFKGSIFAHIFQSAKELHFSSSLIKNASTNTDFKKILNLYPKLDNHVIPNKNLILEGAENMQINVFGHTRILESEETMNVILKKLGN